MNIELDSIGVVVAINGRGEREFDRRLGICRPGWVGRFASGLEHFESVDEATGRAVQRQFQPRRGD